MRCCYVVLLVCGVVVACIVVGVGVCFFLLVGVFVAC